ncbi:hypothetical protein ACFOU0_00890 [Salinicoccus sesuvii]|uniref:Uncharacterized protein n=1 Tax=Salinicoccus sesuvii TaxID=868281 RepID=A0ABV7N3W3_9STAP
MFETITFGVFTLSLTYLAILLSLIITYLMLWDSDEKRSLFREWTITLVILFLIYKITYIFFDWNSFINNPSGVIYYSGGTEGLLIALLAAFGYLFYKSKSLFHVEGYCIFAVSFLALYGILEFRSLMQWHYIALTIITLLALIAIYFIWRRFRAILVISITIFIVQLITRFFIYSGPELIGLSIIQWWLVLSFIYVLISTAKDPESD